jgi:hypothetical protein
MTLAKTNETFIVQASLTIITYDFQNMFIVQATGRAWIASFHPLSIVFTLRHRQVLLAIHLEEYAASSDRKS